MKLVVIIDDKRVRDEMASIQSKTKEPIFIFEVEGNIYEIREYREEKRIWIVEIGVENASLPFMTYNIEFVKIFMRKVKKGLPVKFGYAYLGKPLPVIVYVYA